MNVIEELACYIATELENMDEFEADGAVYPAPQAWVNFPPDGPVTFTLINETLYRITVEEA